jgi:hypothetical protein
MHSSLSVESRFSMAVPVLSLGDGPQFVGGIHNLISDDFRDWVQVYVVSQIALLIFQDLKEAMRSVSMRQVRANCIGGIMMVLRLL